MSPFDDDHNTHPGDFPAAWVHEETVSDARLSGCTLDDVSGVAVTALRAAVKAYTRAVTKSAPRLAAGDPDAYTFTLCGYDPASQHQPCCLAVVNGPGFSLALMLRANDIAVVGLTGLES